MNKSYIGYFLSGSLVGATFGYFFVDEIVDFVKNKTNKKVSEVDEEELEARKQRVISKIRKYQDEQQERFMASYLENVDKYKSVSDLEELIEEGQKKEAPMEEDTKSSPYLISLAQYITEHQDYAKVTLSYFAEDDTLVDDNETLMHIEDTISRECLNEFLATGPNDTIVNFYVRRESDGVDYEVLWMNRSFMELWENGNDE